METYSDDQWDEAWRKLQSEFDKPSLGEKIDAILAVNPELRDVVRLKNDDF